MDAAYKNETWRIDQTDFNPFLSNLLKMRLRFERKDLTESAPVTQRAPRLEAASN